MNKWKVNVVNDYPGYPFIVIDNWYTQEELDDIWKELDLYLSTEKSKIDKAENGPVARYEDGTAKSNAFRFYIDSRYPNSRENSPILNCMYKQTSKEFFDIIDDCKPYMRGFKTSNFDTSMVSYYENNSYYHAHHDTYLWTNLIWVYKEPKQFEGGDLFLDDIDVEIKLKNNRAVFFPSCFLHRVNTVKMKDGNNDFKYGKGRFCITHFYGAYPPLVSEEKSFIENKTQHRKLQNEDK